MNRGIVFAASAYTLWGLFPLYIQLLKPAAPLEILAHRMVWSLAFVTLLLFLTRHLAWIQKLSQNPQWLWRFAASAVAITINWGTFIWGINNGHVIDCSLGYFINPLVNVLLGVVFLHERLRTGQWVAVGIATLGVAWLTFLAGHPPWIGLALAISFSIYGLIRKTAPLGALEGLCIETTFLFPFALGYLCWIGTHAESRFVDGTPTYRWLLASSGPATAIPLLLFSAGARRIPFTTLGLLQYIGPTLQLILGITVFHEAFSQLKLAGYCAIWLALALYLLESWHFQRKTSPPPPAP